MALRYAASSLLEYNILIICISINTVLLGSEIINNGQITSKLSPSTPVPVRTKTAARSHNGDPRHHCASSLPLSLLNLVSLFLLSMSMESLTRKVDAAIASNDDASLSEIFSPTGMTSLGQGEQRALCGYLVKKAVTTPNFLPKAFQTLKPVLTSCLGNLPMTVDNAADSTLRLMLFDYLVNEESDYSTAARLLGGMRMESEPNSIYFKTPAETCDGKFACMYTRNHQT